MTILCEPDHATAQQLAPSLGGAIHTVTSVPAVAMAMAADPAQRVVVFGAHVPLGPVLSFASHARAERADAALVLVRSELDPETVDAARDAGVREVVHNGDLQWLLDAVHRAEQGEPAPGPEPDEPAVPRGRIVTVFSAKGGTGKTTLATNLAVVLNAEGARRVCLVDLDLEFGDVAISMQLTPNRTLIDAVEAGGLDATNLDSVLTPHRPGLDCVLAPIEPGDAERISAQLVGDLLAALQNRYEYVVVDTPSQFSEQVLVALDHSHHHVLLTTPEIPALKNLRLTLDMLDLLAYNRDARSIVFNRADPRAGLSSTEVESAIKSPITVQVPASYDVPASINRGVPLTATDPEHPVSQAIRQLAVESITGESLTPSRRSGRRGMKLRMRST